MNHMNLFMPYEHHNEWHEDVLTRNFLYLIKALPEMRKLFVGTFAEKYGVKISDKFIESFDVSTQVTSTESFFDSIANDTNVISILISDEKFSSTKNVEFSDRYARYDGIIKAVDDANDAWLFVIENKPCKDNVWEEQLDLNLGSACNRVKLNPNPCCLSWREIINTIGNYLAKATVSIPVNALVNDFLEYVDENYSQLKPYDKFAKCGRNFGLVQRRCRDVLTEFANGVPSIWHKGWMYYADSGDDRIKKIGFDVEDDGNGDWQVSMWLFAGDTMNGARGFYDGLKIDSLKRLLEQDKGFSIKSNFHLSFMQTNLIWFNMAENDKEIEYASYWAEHYEDINQVPREHFLEKFKEWLNLGFAIENDKEEFDKVVMSKAYEKVNLCPGFLIKYTWSKKDAIDLDESGKFVSAFRAIKEKAFSVMR